MANLETSTDANVVNPAEAAGEAPKTNNLSDLAQDLMSSHAHRPGLVQEDLAKATEALHANGALANLSIIGLDGKDLIARDEQGQTLLLDASNPENQQVLSSDLVSQPIGANGRTAELAADGSGKYTVVSGDSCWKVANDILTAQGVEQPTDNQIANYVRELEVSNGRSFAQLQVGDEIIIPTKIQGGENSQFTAPEATEPTNSDTTNTDVPSTQESADSSDTTVPALAPEAAKQMELEKFGIDNSYALMAEGYARAVQYNTHKGTYSKPSASLDDINNALNRDDLTANERLGLGMLQTEFDYLKNSEDGTVHLADLERGRSERYQEIDAKYSQAPADASADPNVSPNLAPNAEFDPYAGIFPAATDGATTQELTVPSEVPAISTEAPAEELSMSLLAPFFNTGSIYEADDSMAA